VELFSVLGLTDEEKKEFEDRRDKKIQELQKSKALIKTGERRAREREVQRSWYNLE
jgi:hypothetical protein